LYWIHGGGYVLGTAAQDDVRLSRWCSRLDIVAVSVDYRLAPEHPYPAPLDDCYSGLLWICRHGASIGVDTSRIGVGGQSAGGGLAAALALLARDRREVEIRFQLLMCPMLDDRGKTVSASWDDPVWSASSNRFGWMSYLGDLFGQEQVPGYAAPARERDLGGLPPAFVSVGSMDGFVDECIDYAQRLNHAGNSVELHVYPGAPHGFEGIAVSAELSRQARRDVGVWLGRVTRPGATPAPSQAL
jgi:acetyl esterase/lipase